MIFTTEENARLFRFAADHDMRVEDYPTLAAFIRALKDAAWDGYRYRCCQ